MQHTYTLKANSGKKLPPLVIENFRTVRVEEPRSLQLDGLTLQLPRAEPDLPVGQEVKVWRDTLIRCEPLQGESAQHPGEAHAKNNIDDHHHHLQQRNERKYLLTTLTLLGGTPGARALRSQLESLRSARGKYEQLYKKTAKAKVPAQRQKAEDARVCIASIEEAMVMVSKHLVERLAEQGITGGAAYAYGPGEGVHYDVHTPGRDHFQLALPLVRGRLVRQMGDVMCKPSRQFWGLRITDDRNRISCRACLRRMLSLLEK